MSVSTEMHEDLKQILMEKQDKFQTSLPPNSFTELANLYYINDC